MNISLEKRSVTCEIFTKFLQPEEGYSNNKTLKKIRAEVINWGLGYISA